MRNLIIVILLMCSLCLLSAVEVDITKGIENMSYEELVAKYERITQVKKFLETGVAEKYPWSMNQFFDQGIYERLVGNEFFGYYHDEGVRFSGKRVAIDTIAVIKGRGYEQYRETYSRVFMQALQIHKKFTFQVDPEARYSIGICIVSVKEKDDIESLKGLVLETYIKDRQTGKYFYHRCGTGSSGDLEHAMRISAARIICNLLYLNPARARRR